ncbi:right-handed parallel beta-helix repeat-containing protein [Aquimarina gracilis]|uniref:Right-handed parallel beta-helix repeat-containing protein n=1 Tax=Aquimarina gracilis TaxID=874422 RepID=A0ABU5ZZP8_9FLAO|nr:right-handed parallel beta-helix repeat-containing protein [Aquimarina gracilis]MEB3347295.1 right-handed parallel beta-helix repeat-containing protein [Aquimarina gracilis]
MYSKIILFVSALFIIACSHDSDELISPSERGYELKSGISIIEINNTNDPIFELFRSNNTVELQVNTKYIFRVPIVLNDINNLTINGNNAKFCFPFDGIAVSILNGKDVLIKDLTIDNKDSSGNYYLSGIEKGRVDVRSSSFISLDNVMLNEQRKPQDTAKTRKNHIQVNLYNSTNCSVLNSNLRFSNGELIVVDGSNDCLIKNNVTYGGWSGIATKGRFISPGFYRGYRTIVDLNEVYDCTTAGITINDRQTEVTSNTIKNLGGENVGGPGIRFGHALVDNGANGTMPIDHLTAKNCVARGNIIDGFLVKNVLPASSPVGIKIDASVDKDGFGSILIEENQITNCRYGITVSGVVGQSGQITNNAIQVLGNGIDIFALANNPAQKFDILGNTITTNGSNFSSDWGNYAFRYFNSFGTIKGNTINLTSSNKYAAAIGIARNTEHARVTIQENILNLNRNHGIFQPGEKEYLQFHRMKKAHIENNTINNSYIGMLLKCEDSKILNNEILDATGYGMLFWDTSKNNEIAFNTISVQHSACIRIHNTENTQIHHNNFALEVGESLYAIYKTAWNGNPTIHSNNNLNFPFINN